ncbi:GntR family transcriptional regulator [Actinokineospora sp. NBRC 105648]|uniref:GntR family transcriptional regulator n=1 Tax=Actinokineospora sp. NBRC 105648 TaxID=3032206 RepID=UPI0024A2B008|nr:GntR family transcriptional regulator [Actinokineospora sp. NBRC 105648]GLZ40677.1 GntR family transcriptional regulator [Actinokineospora sp. NBRC 105648]
MAVDEVGARLTQRVSEQRRERNSAAENAAAALRGLIMDGALRPGDRVNEETFMGPLEVSRNTLRESFRLLAHEKLLVHKLNRGAFVRSPQVDDVTDLFRVSRVVELPALSHAEERHVSRMADIVAEGREAVRGEDWARAGTADLRFHQAIVAAASSPRLNELIGQVAAELRLAFDAVPDQRAFHEKHLARDGAIVSALSTGDRAGAHRLLESALDDAEAELVTALRAQR